MKYLHAKFHQNRSTLSTQNCIRKSKIRQKIPQKSSLSLRHCQNMAGTYEPWAEIPLGDSWWCPKKIWRPWETYRCWLCLHVHVCLSVFKNFVYAHRLSFFLSVCSFLVLDMGLYTLPCWSVRRVANGLCATAPAQQIATGLPCIRPCFISFYRRLSVSLLAYLTNYLCLSYCPVSASFFFCVYV